MSLIFFLQILYLLNFIKFLNLILKDSRFFLSSSRLVQTTKKIILFLVLFLQPKNSKYGYHYDSGQMRIAFAPGNEDLGKELSGGVILGPSDEGRRYGMRYSQGEEHWGNAFHTYVLKWKEGWSLHNLILATNYLIFYW